MSDVIFIALMIVFFILCTLYVQLCDRMIGPEELAMVGRDIDSATDSAPDSESPTFTAAMAGSTEATA
jgi:hypothetical protein